MSKNISIKVNSGKQTIETIKLNTASDKLVIKAQAHVNYELVDEATQYAPETIDTKRVGNDLHIAFEGTDINQETDLVIEGYYENDNTELLIGMAENGKYYAYVPQSGIESDAITMLADQVFAPQALGGKEFAAPLWLLNPNWLWLAAGGLAVGGIAGSSSGSGGSEVAKPTVEAKANGSVEVTPPADEHTKLVTVSYTDDDDKLHMVTLSKEANGKWQSSDPEIEVNSETGKVIIPSNKVKAGSKLTAKAIDHNGHEGEEVVVDVVIPAVPEAPKITANEDGSVEIVPPKDADIKSVEVRYVDNAGKEHTAIVSKGNDGNWVSNNSDLVIDPNTGKVTISASKVKDGSHVIAKAINEIGNVGEAAVDISNKAVADALDKVKAAEAAEQAAEKALADAKADDIITADEVANIKALNDTVNSTKAAADAAVKALPENVKDAEGNTPASLQTRVDNVNPVAVPGVDENGNGIDDAQELKDALDKVKAAEAAEQAAEKALDDAKADGIITQKEADNLTKLNAKVAETKDAAAKAVEALPATAKDAEGNTPAKLQTRVDNVNEVNVPAVTEAKVTIVNYTDDYAGTKDRPSTTGTFGTNTKTDDNTPTIKGTTTLPSSKVYLYEINSDGVFVKLGTTTAESSGNWSYTPTWLTNREHKIYASSTEITAKEDAQSSIVIDVEGITNEPLSVALKGEYWSATTVGDINGDGYDDIGMGSWIGNKADAIKGGKALILNGNIYINQPVWHQAGVGDVNGDGYNDILFGSGAETGGTAQLYAGSSNGLDFKTNIGSGIAAAAGDVNGDGIVDMIVMGATSSNVYYGSTNGSYAKSEKLSFGYNSAGNGISWGAQQYAAGVGDFNGDGYNDVVTTNGIYFGSANGLSDSNKISFNHAVTSANAAGDVNGDGYADVVVVDGKYGNSYVLFGGKNKDTVSFSTSKGNGSVSGANDGFAISTAQGSLQTADYSNAVGIGDVNGDGLADVLITTYGNTGSGTSARGQYTRYKTDSYIVFGKTDTNAVDPSALGKKGLIMPNNQADGSSSVGMVDVDGDGLADVYINSFNTSGKLFLGGSRLGAEPTIQGSGVVTANEHSNFIVGSDGNDTIYGKGGADIIYAGSGDDRIVLNADNLNYLSEGFKTANADGSKINDGNGRLARIDGGNGHNTLAFEDGVTTVDLTKISNAGTGFMKTAVGMSRIANIDHVDLTGDANKLILEAKDVLDMNHGLKSYTADVTHQLMVTGDAGDTVSIKDVSSNWTKSSATVTVDSHSYNVYTSNAASHGAQLLVEEHVHVEFIA